MTQEYKLKKERWKREMAVRLILKNILITASFLLTKFNISNFLVTLEYLRHRFIHNVIANHILGSRYA